jgi:hypothetical protein
MYFETLKSPDQLLCPVGTVLTLGEVAQITEHNAAMIRREIANADAFRITPGFAFKILESLDDAGYITPEDLEYAHSGGDDEDATPYPEGEYEVFPPPIDPMDPLENLLDEHDEDENEGRGPHFR